MTDFTDGFDGQHPAQDNQDAVLTSRPRAGSRKPRSRPDTGSDDGAATARPKTAGFKKTADRIRSGDAHLGHRPSLEFHLSSRSLCERADDMAGMPDVAALREMIGRSKTGQSMLEAAGVRDVTITLDSQTEVSQFYPIANVIALNPARPVGELINILSRELRRAWQHHQGLLLSPLHFEPDNAVLINRAQTADTLMISVRVAWELKLSGESLAWDYLVGSPLGDVGRVYELKARDFRTLNNGEAVRSAYDQWFQGNRTKAIDKSVIHHMLLDETGYIKDLGRDKRVTLDLIARYGDMPYSRNYMNVKGYKDPTDQGYASVEDRSNANFLWFIKFERSFIEREKQMIEQSIKKSAEIVDFARALARRVEAGAEEELRA